MDKHDLTDPMEKRSGHWDVALEALIIDEYRRLGRVLSIGDFRALAGQYQIRFDDIMATVLELTVQGYWGYQRRDGLAQVITQTDVEALYKNGRINAEDLGCFSGGWFVRQSGDESTA